MRLLTFFQLFGSVSFFFRLIFDFLGVDESSRESYIGRNVVLLEKVLKFCWGSNSLFLGLIFDFFLSFVRFLS